MADCFQIKTAAELIEYLKQSENKDAFYDFDYQLQTNYGFVYNLKTGKVVFIPHNFKNDGLIFADARCFNEITASDKYPIEEPVKDIYVTEIEQIKNIHKEIDFFLSHLNRVLKFDFKEISKEAAQVYLKKVIGRTIKRLTTDKDIVALIAIFGEIIRREINGQWVIEKWYGMYNPHYKPRILDSNNKLIFIDDAVLGHIKWKVSNVDMIFNKTEGIVNINERNKYHECKILGNR